ncbi:MAG: SH3 domain-containing protein [Spirochaetes bacterium]|nr:SH3 domain-containing protein [Spirochaetota bacterium]
MSNEQIYKLMFPFKDLNFSRLATVYKQQNLHALAINGMALSKMTLFTKQMAQFQKKHLFPFSKTNLFPSLEILKSSRYAHSPLSSYFQSSISLLTTSFAKNQSYNPFNYNLSRLCLASFYKNIVPINSTLKTIISYHDNNSFKKYNDFVTKYSESLANFSIDNLDNLNLERLNSLDINNKSYNLKLTADSIVDENGESVTYEEIERYAETIVNYNTNVSITENYINIYNETSKSNLKSIICTILREIVTDALVSITVLYFSPVLPIYQTSTADKAKKQISSEIKKISKEFNMSNIKENYKIVNVAVLNVRRNHSNKSEIIGTIYDGYLVKIIKKQSKWVLIEYEEGDIFIRGYVYSKYLKTIK